MTARKPKLETPRALSVDRLRPRCDPALIPFASTDEVHDGDEILGQERVREALSFALSMQHRGYNAYVLGPEGSGRRHLVMRMLRTAAAKRPVPPDLLYVYCFEQPTRPTLITLPAGLGTCLRADLARLVEDLPPAIAAAFESEEHLTLSKAVDDEFEERQRARIEEIRVTADRRGVGVLATPTGIALVPVYGGQPIAPDALNGLAQEEQDRITAAMEETSEEVAHVLRELPRWTREHADRVRQLDRKASAAAIDHLLEPLLESWSDHSAVVAHLTALRDDVIDNHSRFQPATQVSPLMLAIGDDAQQQPWGHRYLANLLVSHEQGAGAPLIYEDHPTLANLVGKIEHHATMGTLVTDFSLVRPGCLHRANGGYLVVEARKLLSQAGAWEQLLRTLRSAEIRIESLGEAFALTSTSTSSLQPQPGPWT